ncbi:two-component response regulator-like aprr5 [Phtheirospermum japonicum]|uniref:Two-component response regulator-like aprr5 n=1 Tax=Phtheirospermum japonicum TaxID=374723 RepID=A0A830CBH2_9LAMI|nr:two-component response regulator-like aprr5 [Phtheirospermum japonicum]
MGELVLSTEIGTELEKNIETETAKPAGNKSRKMNSAADGGAAAAAGNSGSVVQWERFSPNMAMRVLLVEADDSTRQIVGALLRKCSYKVAAVSDGLKAWELIKGRAHSIDLILTEVELPSISGYALLTLIMEHDICKNIPVIMMSSHDSVSTVYNCMLRGAADFLVKPLRKNELRNLWQHVWRKQASSASGPGPPEESLAQQKIEATAENNDVSNHSSGYMACLKRNRECIERGSDAQSSCTKPELEVEGANCPSDENSSREAIDLIGPFDNYLKGTFEVPVANASMDKFNSLPPLDLSLRRSNPSCSVNQVNDETRRLNHSDASAFSRYKNKQLQPRNSTSPSTCNQKQKNHETNSEKQLSNHTPDRNTDRISSQKHISVHTFSYPEPIPVKRVRIENVMNGFVSMMPQMYPPHSGLSPLSSPCTVNNLQFYPQLHSLYPCDGQHLSSQQIYTIDRTDGQKMENLEDESGNINFYTNPISAVNEEGFVGASDRSMQRIAALNKFRQKRKDRCFEKKVRYESRKKLAEQRPRVKGQFVRHLPNSPQLGSSSDV